MNSRCGVWQADSASAAIPAKPARAPAVARGVSTPASTPASAASSAGVASASLILAQREASLEEALMWLTRIDALNRAMETQLNDAQYASLERSKEDANGLLGKLNRKSAQDPAYAAVQRQPRGPSALSAGATGGSGSGGPVRLQDLGREGSAPPANTQAWSVGAPIVMLALVLTMGLYFGRDRKRIVDSDNYKTALKSCEPLLYALPEMRSPREAKRFVNITRYLAVRINAAAYIAPSWLERRWQRLAKLTVPLTAGNPDLQEDQIVVLTALHTARPSSGPSAEALAWLADPLGQLPQGLEDDFSKGVRQAVASISAKPWPSVEKIGAFLRAFTEIGFGPSTPGIDPSAETNEPGSRPDEKPQTGQRNPA